MLAERRQMLAPALGKERIEIRGIAESRMDVAIDDGETLGRFGFPDRNVHGTVSFRGALSPSAASPRKRG